MFTTNKNKKQKPNHLPYFSNGLAFPNLRFPSPDKQRKDIYINSMRGGSTCCVMLTSTTKQKPTARCIRQGQKSLENRSGQRSHVTM